MNGQHTQGRLSVAEWENEADGNFGWDLSINGHRLPMCDMEAGPEDDPEANARRLAACWNACEGLSTEQLEREGTLNRANVMRDILRVELAAQRDELQEAVLAMIDREDNDCMPAGWSVDRVREIARKLRRSSGDRAVRRQHDEDYLAHSVESTRTGRAT